MFSMIFLLVLSDPCTAPVAADDKKNEMSTIQRYLYNISAGFSSSPISTSILSYSIIDLSSSLFDLDDNLFQS